MASVPTDHERMRDEPVAELLRSLVADIRLVFQLESELVRLELREKGSRLAMAGELVAGAVAVALFALGTFVAAAVLGLAIVVPAWASALIVGAVLVMLAVVLFLVGRARMRAVGSLAPTETIETVREDVAWIGRATDRVRSTE